MGIWDAITNTVKKLTQKGKDIYNQIDDSLGGYLPGGQTPQQDKARDTARNTTSSNNAANNYQAPTTNQNKDNSSSKKNNSSSSSKQYSYDNAANNYQEPNRDPAPAGYHNIPGGVEQDLPSGWENVKNVMSIALNPFDPGKISAPQVQNAALKWGLETAANNPYTTAAVLTGLYGLGKAGVSLITSRAGAAAESALPGAEWAINSGDAEIAAAAKTAAKGIAKNTVTQKLTGNMLSKAGFTIGASLFILGEAAATYPFAQFNLSEAMQSLQYARTQAVKNKDEKGLQALDQLQEEILNPSGWDKIISQIPWANVQRASTKIIQAATASSKVFNKIIADQKVQQETGETDEQKWDRIKKEQSAQDKAAVDYYNSERKKMLKWEQEAYAAARAATRAEEIKARNEDAVYWAAQQQRQRELEAADRQAIADFWNAYRKAQQKLSEDNSPSHLGFGLL